MAVRRRPHRLPRQRKAALHGALGLLGIWWSLRALLLVAILPPAAPKDGAPAPPLRWWANRKNVGYWLVYSAAGLAIAIAVNVGPWSCSSTRGAQ